ncbi:Splicing factor 3b, subunit 2 [Trachipleistophora hominis]|uniref:Splicing factor 3b, subunit 2 n=1 Tax=Trachipleistophora hominis TaxID=72359 RepID=L7JRL7_TRAHO|nr:Splicing factor 3b, subunit 2 [Trachipleistophora hominis]
MAKKIKKDSFYVNNGGGGQVRSAVTNYKTNERSECTNRTDDDAMVTKDKLQDSDFKNGCCVKYHEMSGKKGVNNTVLDKHGDFEVLARDTNNGHDTGGCSLLINNGSRKKHKALKMNRKRRKHLLLQSKFEELKLIVDNPATVDIEDVSAPNPVLLNKYKNTRNAVPVPSHWKAGKMTFYTRERYEPPFVNDEALKMRETFYEHADKSTEKQREREKKYPKMTNEFLIPQETMKNMLRSAYVSSRLLRAGILYDLHEGMKIPKTDNLLENMSTELKKACGMKKCTPPPWLHNMQRIGPPPDTAYQIPGVNCEIPDGCKYGYDEDGWGKLPVGMDG